MSVRSSLLSLLIPGAAVFAAPSVTTLVPANGSTVAAFTSIRITFSEPVTGVDANDLSINSESPTAVTGSGAGPYVFTFTQPPAGVVGVSWEPDHGITAIGTGEFNPAGGYTFTLADNIAPGLAATFPPGGATLGVLSGVSVTFSESVTGVDAADLLVNDQPATTVTGSNAGPYVFALPQPPVGPVILSWASGHGIVDAAGNGFGGAGWAVTRSAAGAGTVVINEILALNGTGIVDEDAEQTDWIEIRNTGAAAVNLAGWTLTNDPDEQRKWVFPSRTLAAGGYLVVFASGKNRAPLSGNLHTNFKLNENGESVILLSPDFPPPVAPGAFNPYPVQRTDYSYGRGTGGNLFYFTPPTPNASNAAGTVTSLAATPTASVTRGFFKDPFSVVLSCATPGATIRYTLDGSVPTASSAAYTTPINVSATAVLRAAAFATDLVPSATATHSYLFLDSVFAQASPPYDNPANGSDNSNPKPPGVGGTLLPVSWGTNTNFNNTTNVPFTNLGINDIPADYGMDPKIWNDPNKYDDAGAVNPAGKTNLQRASEGLRELPILSVVLPSVDMWGPGASALYPSSTASSKTDRTKACSIEMLLPDGSTAFAVTCGIDLHGNASRDSFKNPKHGFTLKFKGDYGPSNLDYAVFTDSPVAKHDKLVLRADFNYSWRHQENASQRPFGMRARDAWCKDTFRAMGRTAGHHRYVNLFINGIYWGSYDLAEDEGDNFGADYFGGEKTDYDVMEQGIVKSGTQTAYNAMIAIASPIDNTKYEQMKAYLDVPHFVDYMLLHFFVGHTDWGDNVNKNWYAVRNWRRNGTYKFLPWDMENLLAGENDDRTGVAAPPGGLHPKLVGNAQYLLDFADRVHRQMVSPDGALQPAANIVRLNKWTAIANANQMALESARWGDYRRDVHRYTTAATLVYTWNGKWHEAGGTLTGSQNWLAEINRLKNTYFPARTANVLAQLRSRGLYPTVNAPEIRSNATNIAIASQTVPPGFVVKFANVSLPVAGTTNAAAFYYTTNSADPRVYYTGAISTSASIAAPNTTLAINGTTTLKVRAFNGTTWSALNEQTFSVGTENLIPPVRITEIMFNPPGSTNEDAREFIELRNVGSQPVNVSNWFLDGVDCIIPHGTVLNPGDHFVLASNDAPAIFTATYPGVAIGAYFGGRLDNAGEHLTLRDESGRTIASASFDADWFPTADGGGKSLEITDPDDDPSDISNWHPSAQSGGSPGAPNSTPAESQVVINEFLVNNAGAYTVAGSAPGYVELFNSGATPADIGEWKLISESAEYFFPGGTTIPSGGYLVVHFGAADAPGHSSPAALPISEGAFHLLPPTDPSARISRVRHGPQAANFAFGKVGGAWVLTTPTPGAANVPANTAPQGSLRINEWLAASSSSKDWIELYNTHPTLPVALPGIYVGNSRELFKVKALSAIAPISWARLFCDHGSTSPRSLAFDLPATGAALRVLDSGGAQADSITFGAQQSDVSQGRLPDGIGPVTTLAYPSPGIANHASIASAPQLNEILASNLSGDNAPWVARPGWIELRNPTAAAFAMDGWRLRYGDGAFEWRFPAGTTIAPGQYLAIWHDAERPASTVASAHLNAPVQLLDVQSAELLNPSGQVADRVTWGRQIPDASIGRLTGGGWNLLATPTRAAANSGASALGPTGALRINEWSSLGAELLNTSALPIALAGLFLSDDPSEIGRRKFAFPPLSFIAGNGYAFCTRAETGFEISAGGESLRLARSDDTLIDAVSFGRFDPYPASMGRQPDGAATIAPSAATLGLANVSGNAPAFTQVPRSMAIAAGAAAYLQVQTVNASSWQWHRNGVPIPGAVSPIHTIDAATGADDGIYTCVATGAGSTSSPAIMLTVLHSYDSWIASFGNSGAPPDGDLDRDGISNLAEFLANTDPTITATPSELAAHHVGGGAEMIGGIPVQLTLDFRLNRRAAFTALEGEMATSLPGPFLPAEPTGKELLGVEANGDQHWRYRFQPAAGMTPSFLRLRLTK